MRLIDADKLWDAINEVGGCDAPKGSWANGWDDAIDSCIGLVEDAPTVKYLVKPKRRKMMTKKGINRLCECTECEYGRNCYMYEKFQRLPRPDGLGLCPKLSKQKPEGSEKP